MKYAFAAVYVLVLATQLPHIWFAYASLENATIPLAQWTALGAAIAFEASIGIFTYRIVKGSRRRWTRRGLWFFIVASVVANGYYYGWLPVAFGWLMPVFATVALPVALALFAEEFGAEVKRGELAARQEQRRQEKTESLPKPTEPSTDSPTFTTKRQRILYELEQNPTITQAEIVRMTGISPAYVSEVVRSNHREKVTP